MALTAKQKRNLRKWVEALESGEYEQGTGDLRAVSSAGEAFCCFGVWCKVGVAGRWSDDESEPGTYLPRRKDVLALNNGDIAKIREDLGLTWAEEKNYITKNDKGSSFRVIAVRIRKDHPEAFA